jgi:hypothetical protein
MRMTKERQPAMRTLRGWAVSVLQEAGPIRECEEHGWMQARADPHAQERLSSSPVRIRRPASLRRRPSLKFGTPGLARRHLPGASASLIALAAIGRRSAIAMECSS